MKWHGENPIRAHMVERAKRRMASGHYDDPRITQHVVERLAADLDMEFPTDEEIAQRIELEQTGRWCEI